MGPSSRPLDTPSPLSLQINAYAGVLSLLSPPKGGASYAHNRISTEKQKERFVYKS